MLQSPLSYYTNPAFGSPYGQSELHLSLDDTPPPCTSATWAGWHLPLSPRTLLLRTILCWINLWDGFVRRHLKREISSVYGPSQHRFWRGGITPILNQIHVLFYRQAVQLVPNGNSLYSTMQPFLLIKYLPKLASVRARLSACLHLLRTRQLCFVSGSAWVMF